MSRRISSIEASDIFWDDLKSLRKESWYADLRRSIARFVTDIANGHPVRERGFTNPRLKGVMHVSLPRDMRLFHVYPEDDTLRLCLVVDHKVYGFNGKNKGREGKTADRVWRAAEGEPVRSPFWEDIKWRRPCDLIGNPELHEMSFAGLHGLADDLDEEADSLRRLRKEARVSETSQIPCDVIDGWLEDLISAQDSVFETIECLVRERRQALRVDDFENWMEP